MKALQNLSPNGRLLLEGLGAMVVITVLEAERDFATMVPEEVREKLVAIASHQSSLIAEHFYLEDTIFSLHQERLKSFLDPNAPSTRPTKQPIERRFSDDPRMAKKEAVPSRSWFSGWFGGREHQIQAQKAPESEYLEESEAKDDSQSPDSATASSRPIATADVQELCANLLGVDADGLSRMMQREGGPPEVTAEGDTERIWPGERAKRVSRENRLALSDEKEQLLPPVTKSDIQDRYLLFPDLSKFHRASDFHSLQPGTTDGKGETSLLCRVLGSYAETSRHLEALERDFTNSHDILGVRWMDVATNWQTPKEATGKAIKDTYLSALALSAFFFGVRHVLPPLGSTEVTMGRSMLTKGFAQNSAWRRMAFSPIGLVPVGALLVGPLLLNNDRGVKLLRYITVDGDIVEDGGKDRSRKGKADAQGAHLPFLLDNLVQNTMSQKAGTTVDQPVTAERLEYLVIDKPVAETVLFTGVVFRSLMQIPGLTMGGRLAAHLFSANLFAEWQAERPTFTPIMGWFKEEGGVSDMGLYSLSFLQALAMQYLYSTTSTSLFGLARPMGWSVLLYALMALNETKDALTSPFTRLDNIPLYNSAVKAMVKQYQAEYFRLSRQVASTEESINRASTHCTAYMFWLRGLAPPLRVMETEGDDDDRDVGGDDDQLAHTVMAEMRYRRSLKRTMGKGEKSDKQRQKLTLVDLHSFLMEVEHMTSALTLFETVPAPPTDSEDCAGAGADKGTARSKEGKGEREREREGEGKEEKIKAPSVSRLRPLSLFDDRVIKTLETLHSLNSSAVDQTLVAVPAADEKERELRTAALLNANRTRLEQAAATGKNFRDPLVRAYMDTLHSIKHHALFEFLKAKYSGKDLTFEQVESELPKLLSMIDVRGENANSLFRLSSSALTTGQLLEQLPKVVHAHEKGYQGFASSRGLPSLLDYVPSSWNDVESDVTHEALLDVIEALYSRMRTQRLQEAKNFATKQRDQFWLRRAGIGRPTKREMEAMRQQMLDHVMSKTGRSSHEFLASLGLTRYKLYVCINRCNEVDSSKQLKNLAESWEKYLNSRQHFDEMNKAFLAEFMAGKQQMLYLTEH